MLKIGIVGANGYTGLELMQILQNHKHSQLCHVVSRSNVGTKLRDLYPNFDCDLVFEDIDLDKLSKCDVVFTALPHAASAELGGKLFDLGVKIIDLSADFRYNDIAVYERDYKIEHPRKDLNKLAVYGLPEIYAKDIKKASIIGNPGCYTTCSILSLFPLLKSGLIEKSNIIIDAKSGTSGAGRKADLPFAFCEVNENFKAYGVTNHRHTSEIEEKLSIAAGEKLDICFTPHLLPVQRGILATIYANLKSGVSKEDIEKAYSFYENQPFTRVYSEGTLPELKWVRHSNFCDIGFKIDKRLNKIIVVGAIDNLVKGAAGQAVQNMNLMFSFDETEGLQNLGKYL